MSAIRIIENVILKSQVIMISVRTIVSWAAYRFILDTNLLEANFGDLKTFKKIVNVVSNTNQPSDKKMHGDFLIREGMGQTATSD